MSGWGRGRRRGESNKGKPFIAACGNSSHWPLVVHLSTCVSSQVHFIFVVRHCTMNDSW